MLRVLECDADVGIGVYNDRRTNRNIDCSKFIWILATNYGDVIIQKFYENEVCRLSDKEREAINLERLQDKLKDAFMQKFGVSRCNMRYRLH